jgi:quinol monooxygenase YgiN
MRVPLAFLLGLALVSFAAPAARADDANTAYVVTYFETAPADTGKARSLLQQFSRSSRKESGNLRIEVLQRVGQPDQFVILEAWLDKDAHATHLAAGNTAQFREKLKPLLRGPYDERPHTGLSVGAVKAAPAGDARAAAVYAVTHVDIVPKEKDTGVAMVKQLAEDGRKDAGNVRFDALTQASRPNHMTVVEIWTDKKAVEGHGVAAYKKQFRDKLMPMSGSLYDERFYKAFN